MIKKTRGAFSYIRFSSLDQMRGDSLRRQTQASEAYAKQNGLVLNESLGLRDLGVSAFRGRNARQGSLAAFLKAIDQGRVAPGSVLIVENLDRLTRNEIDEALELFLSILRRGVSIVTLDPAREYTKSSVKNITGLLEPLFIMARANEESAIKSSRGKACWNHKRETSLERKMTSIAPAWLLLSDDHRRFKTVPAAVKIVRRIFRLAYEGYGTSAICRKLNAEAVPTIASRANSTTWNKSYLTKILANRAVLGECQPHVMLDGKRVPSGDAILGYYPQIIKEAEFYKARKALESRRCQTSAPTKDFVNLFTGLIRDANDGANMVLINKGRRSSGRALVSAKAQRGEKGAKYVSIPYVQVERAILGWQTALQLEDILTSADDGDLVAQEIERLDGQLAKLDVKINKTQNRLLEEDDFDALVDVLKRLESQRRETSNELESKRTELHNKTEIGTLEECKSLVQHLANAKDDELRDLRLRLRAKLNAVVKEIHCKVRKISHRKRGAELTICLQNGKQYKVDAMPVA